MICSSVNLLRFMLVRFLQAGLQPKTVTFGGNGSRSYRRAEMLTHHVQEKLKRRTGLTKARRVKLIALWYDWKTL